MSLRLKSSSWGMNESIPLLLLKLPDSSVILTITVPRPLSTSNMFKTLFIAPLLVVLCLSTSFGFAAPTGLYIPSGEEEQAGKVIIFGGAPEASTDTFGLGSFAGRSEA
ncbi:hypothetical protein BDW22DRAFT_1426656 [Trametopsis cervina]|nr:hypothetical protein BDW22DRAFT_1426656 [Trametopsis cervina]